jgi:hypothetical protein
MGRHKSDNPKSKGIRVRLTEDQYNRLKFFSTDNNMSMSEVIINALDVYSRYCLSIKLFTDRIVYTILEIFYNLKREDVEDIVKNNSIYKNAIKYNNHVNHEQMREIHIVSAVCKELYYKKKIKFIPDIEAIKSAYCEVLEI